MEWFILLLFIIFLFLFLAGITGEKVYGYQLIGELFTPAERSFLGVLDAAVSENYRVFAKVRVADILSPKKGMNRKNWQIAFNKISAKHFDYVLCCKESLKVMAVIELDDKSHNKRSTRVRDELIQGACESASLPLVRVAAKKSYSILEIRALIEAAMDQWGQSR